MILFKPPGKSREPLEPQEMFAETPALLRSIPHHRHRTSYALSFPHLLSNSSVDCGLFEASTPPRGLR
jgi:hypothetical protein